MFGRSTGYREKHLVRADSKERGGDGDVDIEPLESKWMVTLRVSLYLVSQV